MPVNKNAGGSRQRDEQQKQNAKKYTIFKNSKVFLHKANGF